MPVNDSEEQVNDTNKIVMLGIGAVGKTSICRRIDGLDWRPQYNTTIGINLFSHVLKIKGKAVEAIIYDTGGQELFQTMDKIFYKGATGAIIVYDIAERESWDTIDEWFTRIRKLSGIIPVLVLGNKIDLSRERVVDRDEAEDYITKVIDPDWQNNKKDVPVKFNETSAKTKGEEIIAIFERFMLDVHNNRP
jgi:small GTP-binding protein